MKRYSGEERERLQRLGSRLRELRLGRGWSQEDLAERAGLHRTYIGDIERGERNVSLLNLILLAQACDVELRDLLDFGRAGEDHSPSL